MYACSVEEVNRCINSDKDLLKAGDKIEKFAHEKFISKSFLKLEKENINSMVDGQGSCKETLVDSSQSLDVYNIKLNENKGYKLDDEQQQAAKNILETKDFICGVQGYAGTGKTTLLQAVNDISNEHGRKIFGVAPSAKAANILEQETGLKSNTIDFFCIKNKSKINELLRGGLLVMDESSMTGTQKMNEVIKIAKKHNMQIVLVGDRNQLLPIAAGNEFARMQDAGMKTAKLESIRRQYDASRPEDQQELLRIGKTIAKDKNIVEAVKQIDALANSEKDLSKSERRVQVVECQTSRNRLRMAAKEYAEDVAFGRNSIVLTDSNTRREQINKEVRFYLQKDGRIENSEQKITVLNSNGKEISRDFSINERVIFGKNDYKLNVRNNELGTVKEFVKGGDSSVKTIKIQKDDGSIVAIDCEKYKNIDYGYALTIHKSQGISVNKAIVELSSKSRNSFNKEYVALSRHKTQLSIYSDDLKKVAKQGLRQEKKMSAQEIIDLKNKQSNKVKAENKKTKQIENVQKTKVNQVTVKATLRTTSLGLGQLVSQAQTKAASASEALSLAQQKLKAMEAQHNLELHARYVQRQNEVKQHQTQKLKLSR